MSFRFPAVPRNPLIVAAGLALAGSSSAATFTVTTTNDSGLGSFRQAVLDANNSPGGDVIQFSVSGSIPVTSGPLVVSGDLAINGPGADALALDAFGANRVMTITSGQVLINDLALQNGLAPALQPGGGVLVNGGDLTLVRCAVLNNRTQLVVGVNGDGGAIYVNSSRRLTARQCLFAGNQVGMGTGGAVRGHNGSILEFVNCTFSGNSATQGGAVFFANLASFNHCTVVDNSATSAGGGVWAPVLGARVANSIVFRNLAPSGTDWLGSAQSGGFNLLGAVSGSSGWVATDRVGLDPALGPLGDNGGPTSTYALLEGSPALDSADPASVETEDQRGVSRPQGPGGDVGAFELEVMNRPPSANAGDDQTLTSESGLAEVQLDGSGSADPDGDDLEYAWYEGGALIASGVMPTVSLRDGVHVITLVVSDEAGLTAQDSMTATVVAPTPVDNKAPRIRQFFAWPPLLLGPNHTLRNVALRFTVKDNTDPKPSVWLEVKSNQADSGLGMDDVPNDIQVVNNNLVKLRAELYNRHRVYTITVFAKDKDGNVSSRKVKVLVPKFRRRFR